MANKKLHYRRTDGTFLSRACAFSAPAAVNKIEGVNWPAHDIFFQPV
jgi:hypothetical protein